MYMCLHNPWDHSHEKHVILGVGFAWHIYDQLQLLCIHVSQGDMIIIQ